MRGRDRKAFHRHGRRCAALGVAPQGELLRSGEPQGRRARSSAAPGF